MSSSWEPMRGTVQTIRIGGGLSGTVFLVFLVMKLAQIGLVAAWPWLWVTAPLWVPVGILVAGFVALVVHAAVMSWFVDPVRSWTRARRTLSQMESDD